MSLTELDIEAIVERKLQERISELRKSKELPNIKSPWDEVRDAFTSRAEKLPIDSQDQYQLVNALSTIIRNAFGLRLVRFLDEDNRAEATRIATAIADFIEENRNRRAGQHC